MRYLLLFVLLFTGKLSFAQMTVHIDTAHIEGRAFKKETLNALKQDKTFQYKQLQEPPVSLWDRFWNWFWWKVGQILRTREGKTTMWTLFTIFGVAMIVFFVMKVTGMNKDGLFGRNSQGGLRYTTGSEDIHQISFDEAIDHAIADGNYRLATRYLYLQVLKKLSDKGFIQWQLNKTNTDYLLEVAAKPWHQVFRMLTYNFEYTWYGEIPVSHDSFQELRNQFQQFNNQLK